MVISRIGLQQKSNDIDHHDSNDYFGTFNWVDPWRRRQVKWFIISLKIGSHDSKDIAINLIPLITDYRRFSFSNTTAMSSG
jgi:nanoRNase/pAp phosphatase (c-di-AMP/oligoRNAs hydrolase)